MLKEPYFNTYKFSNHCNKNFMLLLWKRVYPYEYMHDWQKLNETLKKKKDSYSHLNMEDITDADYGHTNRICKNFEIKNLEEYHDLCVQSDELLLVDVFENFRNIFIKIYELDPPKLISALRLAWQAALKNSKTKLHLLTEIDMLLFVEKCIRGRICLSIYWYGKANSKCSKNYNKNKESSYLQHWDTNNFFGWAMLQKLPVNNFEWIKDTSQFNEVFIETIINKVMKDIFRNLMFNILKN